MASRTFIACLVGVIGCAVVLGVMFAHRNSNGSNHPTFESTDTLPVVSSPSKKAKHDQEAKSRDGDLVDSRDEHSPSGIEGSAASMGPTNEPARATAEDGNKTALNSGSTPSEYELVDAATAVGRPFPLSPSVIQQCVPSESSCKSTTEFLSKMEAEPRDLAWARETEKRLEAAIERREPGKYNVRAIECRTMRCAIEVAAVNDQYLVDFFDDDLYLSKNVRAGIGTWGHEANPNGGEIVVSVMTFERRSNGASLNSKP